MTTIGNYSIINKIYKDNNKSDFNYNYFLVNIKDPYLMVEIIPKNIEEKFMFMSLLEKRKINEIKIFDEFEEKEKLYIVTDNSEETKKKIENLLEEEEGIIFGQARPITKKEVDDIFEKESSVCQIVQNKKDGQSISGTGFFA